ncbi:hypothetical protein CRUP_028846 [Coryphaenoides rupestris]|nr:hypothetical protein CRUP_028846 [Coryphaenoides rupestris]
MEAGFTAAWHSTSCTALSRPRTDWTQATVLGATPRLQVTEQGPVPQTFHLHPWTPDNKCSISSLSGRSSGVKWRRNLKWPLSSGEGCVVFSDTLPVPATT